MVLEGKRNGPEVYCRGVCDPSATYRYVPPIPEQDLISTKLIRSEQAQILYPPVLLNSVQPQVQILTILK